MRDGLLNPSLPHHGTFRARFYNHGEEIVQLAITIAARTRDEAFAVAALHAFGVMPRDGGDPRETSLLARCESIRLFEVRDL